MGTGVFYCPITGHKASVYFMLRPNTWLELEVILGMDVPPILKGWEKDRLSYGNELLYATDEVTGVGLPWEICEKREIGYQKLQDRYYGENQPPETFSFEIGAAFSKRAAKAQSTV